MTRNYLLGFVRNRLNNTVGKGVNSEVVHAIADSLEKGEIIIIRKDMELLTWELEARNKDGTPKEEDPPPF